MTLTESQKTCLRLVAQGLTSKEIAQSTGLTPSTVDTYLKLAATRLGASNRRDAARQFLKEEQSQQLGSQTPDLPAGPEAGKKDSHRTAAGTPGEWIRNAMAPPPIGGSTNDLTSSGPLIAMLRVACLMAVVVSALTLFSIGMIRLLN